jgi:hypothetical protein
MCRSRYDTPDAAEPNDFQLLESVRPSGRVCRLRHAMPTSLLRRRAHHLPATFTGLIHTQRLSKGLAWHACVRVAAAGLCFVWGPGCEWHETDHQRLGRMLTGNPRTGSPVSTT